MLKNMNPLRLSLSTLIRPSLLGSVSSLLFMSSSFAGPVGGAVVSGSAQITGDPTAVNIQQNSQRVIIQWNSFDIGQHDTVTFQQPNASAVALNKITNGTPTQILGSLRANGQVIVMNPNGVILGQSANVDIASFIASAANIDNDRFMNDARLDFNQPGDPNAKIINNGHITAHDAGLVGFIAPQVENNGVIEAHLGRVQLASGSTFTLDLAGDELVNIAVSDDVVKQLAVNSGTIKGDTIAITAATARNAVDHMIVNTGVIEATSVSQKGGKIILGGGNVDVLQKGILNASGKKGGGTVKIAAKQAAVSGIIMANSTDGNGGDVTITASDVLSVSNNAVIDVFGNKAGNVVLQSPWLFSAGTILADSFADKGGDVRILGDNIYLGKENFINTSGATGGGHIYVGGDFQGKGDMYTATYTGVDKDALFLNSALQTGDGGQTIIWADDLTEFYGSVIARGKGDGRGGFTEVSGKKDLKFLGEVDLTSDSGVKGTLLLDPAAITVYGNFAPNYVSTDGTTVNLASGLKLWLDAADSSTATLTYSTNGLSAATATGTIGSNTITTSVNVASQLTVGARVRLGASGVVTAASSIGADTYVVAAISGTTITLTSNLTQSYSAVTLNRGLVSSWMDKSGQGNNASQATLADMPLWVDNKINGHSVIRFDGSSDIMVIPDSTSLDATNGLTIMTVNTPLTMNGSPNGILSKRVTNDSQDSYSLFYYTGNKMSIDIDNTNDRFSSTQTYVANNTYMMNVIYDGSLATGSRGRFYNQDALSNTFAETSAAIPNYASSLYLGSLNAGYANYLNADYSDVLIYTAALSDTNRQLVNQYLAAKWGSSLTAPGTGATEAAKAMASDGYGSFTTRYLEYLSQSSDINLLATNTITLDLQGDTLNLANDRNITFTTTSGNINSVSSGAITTNRTTAGGNITLVAGGTGLIDIGNIVLNAQNGGVVSLTAGGNITTNNITASGITMAATGAGAKVTANNMTVGSGNISLTADDMALNGAVTGTGTLTLQQNATNRLLNINNGLDNGSSLHLGTADVNNITNGWNRINIGRTNGTNDLFIGAATWKDPVYFRNSIRITFTGGTTAGTGDASINTLGGWVDLYAPISTVNQNVDLSGSGYVWVGSTAGGDITTAGGNILFNRILSQNNGNMNLVTSGGNINIVDTIYGGAGTGRSYVFNAGAGTVNFGNTVNATAAITVTANTITFNSAWGGSNVLGSVSLTSATALALPAIRATTLYAASGAGTDLVLTNALIATGAGNSVILNSGRNLVNAGGSINPGTGRYLIYSADPSADTRGGLTGFNKRYNSTYAGYAPGSVAGTTSTWLYSVAPTITITADTATKIYGAANPAFSYASSGYIDGDTSAILTGTPSLTTLADNTSHVGSYAISATLGSLANPYNYSFAFTDGNLSVTPKTLDVTVDNTSRIYGATDPAFTLSFSGFENGDTDTLFTGHSVTPGATILSGVGAYGLVLTGGSAGGNYTIVRHDGVLTVTPAALTITANDAVRQYNQPDPLFTASYAGFVNGDTDSVITALDFSTASTISSPPGDYAITPFGASAANYAIAFANGTLTIQALPPVTPPAAAQENPRKLWDIGQVPILRTDNNVLLDPVMWQKDVFNNTRPQMLSGEMVFAVMEVDERDRHIAVNNVSDDDAVSLYQSGCLYRLVNFSRRGSESLGGCGKN